MGSNVRKILENVCYPEIFLSFLTSKGEKNRVKRKCHFKVLPTICLCRRESGIFWFLAYGITKEILSTKMWIRKDWSTKYESEIARDNLANWNILKAREKESKSNSCNSGELNGSSLNRENRVVGKQYKHRAARRSGWVLHPRWRESGSRKHH